jgi:hypothetical protein
MKKRNQFDNTMQITLLKLQAKLYNLEKKNFYDARNFWTLHAFIKDFAIMPGEGHCNIKLQY